MAYDVPCRHPTEGLPLSCLRSLLLGFLCQQEFDKVGCKGAFIERWGDIRHIDRPLPVAMEMLAQIGAQFRDGLRGHEIVGRHQLTNGCAHIQDIAEHHGIGD